MIKWFLLVQLILVSVGVLRIDSAEGKPFAVIYNFAAHPILGVPNRTNTADYPDFASKTIEDTLGGGIISFFKRFCWRCKSTQIQGHPSTT